MVEAEFGLMHLTGTRDGPPVKVGVAVTDLTTGLYACNSIMAALLGRANTGEGQHIDVCLSDCQVATLANMGESVLISGKKDSGRWGTAHRKSSALVSFYNIEKLICSVLVASVVPYQGFKTADGDIFVGGANDRLFGILCEKIGKPEWKADARFITNNDRVTNRAELEPLIEAELSKRTTQRWQEIFEVSGLPYAAVNDIQGTMNHEHGKRVFSPRCEARPLLTHFP
jgi:crotonobetainyl-CoA:carnitine CoA-transferase CaiB-like acyl-CoA transferase